MQIIQVNKKVKYYIKLDVIGTFINTIYLMISLNNYKTQIKKFTFLTITENWILKMRNKSIALNAFLLEIKYQI